MTRVEKKRKQKVENMNEKFSFWYCKWMGQIHTDYENVCSKIVVP